MAVDWDYTHVIVNPAARVMAERVFLVPWGPDLEIFSLALAACLRIAIAPHRVKPDPNKSLFSENPWIERSVDGNGRLALIESHSKSETLSSRIFQLDLTPQRNIGN